MWRGWKIRGYEGVDVQYDERESGMRWREKEAMNDTDRDTGELRMGWRERRGGDGLERDERILWVGGVARKIHMLCSQAGGGRQLQGLRCRRKG